MGALVLGLVLFLGVHSVRIVGEGWRTRMRARVGEGPWKGLYSLVSSVGFVLLVWGFAQARRHTVVLWPAPPVWVGRDVTSLLVLVAFVFFVATYVPGNQIKAKLHHPQVLAVKVWAFGHLIANNTLADLVLFGAFLLWAIFDFRSSRLRDRAAGTVYAPGLPSRTAITIAIGVIAWAVFAFWLHRAWIGVSPLAM